SRHIEGVALVVVVQIYVVQAFFCSSRRRHTRAKRDWSSDVCSSDLSLTACTILPPVKLNTCKSPVNTALIATPIKIMRSGSRPDFQEKEYTRINASAPPIKANNGT